MQARARIVALSLLVGGCASAAREAAPEAAQPEHQGMTELDALEHDLNVSEQRLSAELERKRSEAIAAGPGLSKAAPAVEAESAAPSPAPAPAAPTTSAPAPADETEEAAPRSSTIGSACDLACRALASMRRSAVGICSIAGDAHERCSSARSRVQARTTQVAQAGCACRSGG